MWGIGWLRNENSKFKVRTYNSRLNGACSEISFQIEQFMGENAEKISIATIANLGNGRPHSSWVSFLGLERSPTTQHTLFSPLSLHFFLFQACLCSVQISGKLHSAGSTPTPPPPPPSSQRYMVTLSPLLSFSPSLFRKACLSSASNGFADIRGKRGNIVQSHFPKNAAA